MIAYVFIRSGETWSQQAYLKASNTDAGDNFGCSVAISGDTIVVGAENEASSTSGVGSIPDNSASSAGAAYVFVRSGIVWAQQAYLKASNAGWYDNFGGAVAVSGDTIVVGSHFEDSSTVGVNSEADEAATNSGAAYIFADFDAGGSNQAPVALASFQILAAEAGSVLLDASASSDPDALPTATPFNDGVPNLLKYAFNMNLAGPDSSSLAPGGPSGLPVAGLVEEEGQMYLRVEYVRRKNSGLSYTPQKSGNLGEGSFTPLTGEETVSEMPDDPEWERVIIDEPCDPATEDRCFSRVMVELP